MKTQGQIDKGEAESSSTIVDNMQASIVETLANIPKDNTRVFAVAGCNFDLHSPEVCGI